MYREKAAYFDANVNALWAAAEYDREDRAKLDRLFSHTGSLKGCMVLEPGCGTGRLTEILSDQVGLKGLVVAVDISPGMIEEARRRNSHRINVEIHRSAIEDFPMGRERFDLILCHQVFPHFEDKKTALEYLTPALKPRGRFAVVHFINLAEINDLHRKAGTAVEADMMPDQEEMRALFKGCGLEIECLLDDHLGYFLSAKNSL